MSLDMQWRQLSFKCFNSFLPHETSEKIKGQHNNIFHLILLLGYFPKFLTALFALRNFSFVFQGYLYIFYAFLQLLKTTQNKYFTAKEDFCCSSTQFLPSSLAVFWPFDEGEVAEDTSDSRGDLEVNLVSKLDTSSSLVNVGTKGGS